MKSLNDTDFVKVWEVLRKNKFLFAFQYGSLMWGLPVCLFGLIFTSLVWNDMPLTIGRLVIGMVVFVLTGYFMGLLIYAKNEKRYNELRIDN